MRALLFSLPALAVPVLAVFVFPESLADYEALLWLLALIPAFLLAYYRGWQGVATALALGMAVISVTYAVARASGATVPDLLLAVVVLYLAIALGIGWLSEGVSRARIDEAKETLALRDALTDLPNRRQAELHLEQEIAAAERGRPLAVVLFDFDHFSSFNALNGRAAGDGVLRSFGSLLRQNTRRMNMAARYGAEEFVCVLGGCDETGALTFAARVQERLRAAETMVALPTVSAGVACFGPGLTTPEQLLHAAEDALLAAKQSGRDRVRVHGRTPSELALTETERRTVERAHRVAEAALTDPPLTVIPLEAEAEAPVGAGRAALVLGADESSRSRIARQLAEEGFAVSAAAEWAEVVAGQQAAYDVAFVELAAGASRTADEVHELRSRMPGIRIIGVPQPSGGMLDPAVLAVRVDGYHVPSAASPQLRAQLWELLRELEHERETHVISRQLSEEVRAKEREARQAIAATEAKYRAVVQSIQQVIFTTDSAGRWTFLNPAWSAITGLNVEESIGQPFWDTVHAEERAELRTAFERMVQSQSGHFRHEGRWRTRAGSYRWIEARFQIVGSGAHAVENISGLLTDITDRRRAEEALRRSEEYFRSLIENSADVMAVINPDQSIRYVSPAVQRILGYGPDAWPGLADTVHPEDADRAEEIFLEVLSAPGETRSAELRVRRADGAWAVLEVMLRNQLSTMGVEGLVLNARDITERRQAENALRDSETRLARAQKMDAIGRLAGGVAHDFNNLLTAIQGHATLLLEEVQEGQPIRADLFEIRDAAERATTLTRQLLAFSRRQVLQPRVLDLNLVVADIEKMLARMVGEHIELVMELTAPLDLVRADPSQLEQVIVNLVVNSRDALHHGGRIVLRTGNRTVRPGAPLPVPDLAPGSYVMLEVEDNGEGMTAEAAAQAFEPFFTTKEPGRGTGLGLSTVYGILKQSGGHVWLSSESGAGTRVTLYLPRVVETVDATRLQAPRMVASGGTETVLLVEDEKAVRELAQRILERKGYRVVSAENGRQALELQAAFEERIDLLLTDVVMPEMNGPELANRLATLRPGLRVLFMSGYAEEAIEQHGVFGSGRNFMEKPFSPDELLRRVRATLEPEA